MTSLTYVGEVVEDSPNKVVIIEHTVTFEFIKFKEIINTYTLTAKYVWYLAASTGIIVVDGVQTITYGCLVVDEWEDTVVRLEDVVTQVDKHRLCVDTVCSQY